MIVTATSNSLNIIYTLFEGRADLTRYPEATVRTALNFIKLAKHKHKI